MGFASIAKFLNEKQIPSSQRSQKISGKTYNWGPTNVRRILTSAKYVGRWTWGKSKLVADPDTQRLVAQFRPQSEWVDHYGGEKLHEELIIVPIDKWNQVQEMIRQTNEEFVGLRNRKQALVGTNRVGPKSEALLAGLLFCGECGALMPQICGTRGGFYGCYMHNRKDPQQCSNNRMIARSKLEPKVIELIMATLLDPATLQMAADSLNKMIRERLREAPTESMHIEERLRTVTKEISNLINFIVVNGDSSSAIKEALARKESEKQNLEEQVRQLKVVSADKLLVTPFALKAHYQKLSEYFAKDPVQANAALRLLLPNGLKATPAARDVNDKCKNPKRLWRIEG
ncbi:recombinase family protein, partial [Bdellovibrionota bacterium FG-2]